MTLEKPELSKDEVIKTLIKKYQEQIAINETGEPQGGHDDEAYDKWYGAHYFVELTGSRYKMRAEGKEVNDDAGQPFYPNLTQDDFKQICSELNISYEA